MVPGARGLQSPSNMKVASQIHGCLSRTSLKRASARSLRKESRQAERERERERDPHSPRYEDSKHWDKVLNEYFPGFRLPQENRATQKWYDVPYQNFVKKLKQDLFRTVFA